MATLKLHFVVDKVDCWMISTPIDVEAAREVVARCEVIAGFSDEPDRITRTFLSGGMRLCQEYLRSWMAQLGMATRVDAAGNVRGIYGGGTAARRVLLGSHIDTVPDAGRYDGVLGVVLAIKLLEFLDRGRIPFDIEVVAFAEEEGVRFGVPFIGSRALAGTLDDKLLGTVDQLGISVEQAIREFGMNPAELCDARLAPSARAYIEFHIEQGPVLESKGVALGVVEAIVGQSRGWVTFLGDANHAGTTPMDARRDALCGAAEWVSEVERAARRSVGLVATVGRLSVNPGASNAVPGEVEVSLDVRHASDGIRREAFASLLRTGREIAEARGLAFASEVAVDQSAVPMDEELIRAAEAAVHSIGLSPQRMTSGAGHDAMIMAQHLPCGMIFLRSPGGISHHPKEAVLEEDVLAALRAGRALLERLSPCSFLT